MHASANNLPTTHQAEAFVELFQAHPVPSLIANLNTKVFLQSAESGAFPVTLNDATDAPTCYLCCASAAYIDYAREETRNFAGNPVTRAAMLALLRLAAPLVHMTGFDQQVQANNWLLSTNIWCRLSSAGIAEMTRRLLTDWPGRAIIWRSLNEISDRDEIAAFRQAGYGLYPARQVYLFDCRNTAPAIHRDEKRDVALLNQVDYAQVAPEALTPDDFTRIDALYVKLYLQKYTSLNPQYTALGLRLLHEAGILKFFGLRNRDGRLDGVIGFFEQGDVMTAPVVGYETMLDAEVGLYRRLMAIGLRRARQSRMLFNMSAGAASFKRNRGAVAAIEYAAVYNRHLSWRSRAAARLIRTALENVGVPVMRKFKL